MNYHNLVKAGFSFVCALALGITISVGGDQLVSPKKQKAAAGYVVAIATPAHK